MELDTCSGTIVTTAFTSSSSAITREAKMVSTLINTNEDLCFPYSLRIGFHETEMVARKTMMEWFRADDSEVDESNRTGG